MNLQGVYKIEFNRNPSYVVARRWSRCYNGRYNRHGPQFAQALDGRTKLWARYQDYNRRRKPL